MIMNTSEFRNVVIATIVSLSVFACIFFLIYLELDQILS